MHVLPGQEVPFREASERNARNSVEEPGVIRFDLLQQDDDPHRFVLFEMYRDEEAIKAHKLTPHYKEWRERVESMMAEPRRAVRYTPIYPTDEEAWRCR